MNSTTTALLTILALALAACGSESKNADTRATHISKVRTLHLTSNDCPAGIRKALQEHGYALLAEDQPADAALKVTVTRTGRNLQSVPEFGGFGSKANYTAEVVGAENKILFSTAGKEGSITSKEMCEDIGDEIAEKLKGSPLGRIN